MVFMEGLTEKELKDRIAVITGAGSPRGIGWATAEIFAREGAIVVLTDIDPAGLRHNFRLLEKMGCQSMMETADLSSRAEVDRLFTGIFEKYGRVDVLVNNAGITQSMSIDKMTEKDWDDIFRINVRSQYLCIQAVLPKMREQRWGRIVCLSSMSGRGGPSMGSSHYAATKAAIIGFSQSLAKEVASFGITVNVVAPGSIDTDIWLAGKRDDKLAGEELKAKRIQRTPLGRLGTSLEVGEVIAFLSSNRASFITGAVIDVNGGGHMC